MLPRGVAKVVRVGRAVAPGHDVPVVEEAEVQDAEAEEAVASGGPVLEARQATAPGAGGAPTDDLGPAVRPNVVAAPVRVLRVRLVDVATAAEAAAVPVGLVLARRR